MDTLSTADTFIGLARFWQAQKSCIMKKSKLS